jgi:hypothetical protein
MRVTPKIIHIENEADQIARHLATYIWDAVNGYEGKVVKADSSKTVAFTNRLPDIQSTTDRSRVIVKATTTSLIVEVSYWGPDGISNSLGEEGTYTASRTYYLASITDGFATWRESIDEVLGEPKSLSFAQAVEDWETAEDLERQARELKSKYHRLGQNLYFQS